MADEFKPSEGNPVSKTDAEAWIKKYDDQLRADKDKDTRSVFFGRNDLLRVLSQDGCAGISFFFALKYDEQAQQDNVTLVMVGTKEDGTLLWEMEKKTDEGSFDSNYPCPPYCPK